MTAPKRTSRDVGIRQLPSGSWQARYRSRDGKMHQQAFDKKSDAKSWRDGQRGAIATGQHVAPGERTTVTEYAQRWIDARDVRASTRARYQSIVNTHLAGTPLGGMRLVDVQPMNVREWLTSRSMVLSPSSVHRVQTFLSSVFDDARINHLVTWSPADGVKAKSVPKKRWTVVTDDEIEALIEAMPERYTALIRVLAIAGLRIGEALALRVEDVDSSAGVIHVIRSMAPTGKIVGPVKADAHSVRDIPLPRNLLVALRKHQLEFPPIDHPEMGRLLFSTPTGLPVRYHRFRLAFKAAAKTAGVADLTPHGLRHRAGSVMLHRGVPPATAARIMGDTVRVLLATYTHSLPSGDDMARDAMELRPRSGTKVARGGE